MVTNRKEAIFRFMDSGGENHGFVFNGIGDGTGQQAGDDFSGQAVAFDQQADSPFPLKRKMRLGQGDDGRRVDQSGRIQSVGIHGKSKIEEGWKGVKKIRENISDRGKTRENLRKTRENDWRRKRMAKRENGPSQAKG